MTYGAREANSKEALGLIVFILGMVLLAAGWAYGMAIVQAILMLVGVVAFVAGFVVLRLPWTVAPLFEKWLEEHFRDRKEKVMKRVRDLREGKLYDPQWGIRQRGKGIFADQIESMFEVTCRRLHLNEKRYDLSAEAFRRPGRSPDDIHRSVADAW